MPVQYRGGADFAHPHAIFQLWVDAARGTTDHVHADRHDAHADAAHGGHDVPPERPSEVQTAPPNAPSIAGMTAAVERAAAVAAALVVAGIILFGRTPLAADAPLVLAGRFVKPDAPPPRVAALLP